MNCLGCGIDMGDGLGLCKECKAARKLERQKPRYPEDFLKNFEEEDFRGGPGLFGQLFTDTRVTDYQEGPMGYIAYLSGQKSCEGAPGENVDLARCHAVFVPRGDGVIPDYFICNRWMQTKERGTDNLAVSLEIRVFVYFID